MVVFAALCALAIVFVWKFCPRPEPAGRGDRPRLEHQQTSMPEAV